MSLAIGIRDSTSLLPMATEPFLDLDNDGYYWFLHPLFGQLWTETGKYIDLYGDAAFEGESLAALERMLIEARALIESRPDSWEVHIGTQIKPTKKEIYVPVERDQFLKLIDQWEKIIARAKELGRPVACFGD